jgi:hypothetical protein
LTTIATLLAIGSNQSLLGKNFFGYEVQQFINHNVILNNLTRSVLTRNSGYAVYDYGQGQRLTTAYLIFVNGEPKYFLQMVHLRKKFMQRWRRPFYIKDKVVFVSSGYFCCNSSINSTTCQVERDFIRKEVKRRTRELEELYDDIKQCLDTVIAELKRTKL